MGVSFKNECVCFGMILKEIWVFYGVFFFFLCKRRDFSFIIISEKLFVLVIKYFFLYLNN